MSTTDDESARAAQPATNSVKGALQAIERLYLAHPPPKRDQFIGDYAEAVRVLKRLSWRASIADVELEVEAVY